MQVKYDHIGKEYNSTRKADPYLASRMLFFLKPKKDGLCLDIGCGTGNYTIALNNLGVDFIGIDPSEKMLEKARKRNQSIIWKKGIAEAIPLETNSVDASLATLTLHHWNSLDHGFKELNRVLRPDGNMVFFTATPTQMNGYWLNHYFPAIMEKSKHQMPSFETIENNLAKNNFEILGIEKYFIQDNLQDLFLYSGKHRPEYYLDEKIRQGISSFSALANKVEVGLGLIKLKEDIVSGKINQVIADYKNEDGDYLFIASKKINCP